MKAEDVIIYYDKNHEKVIELVQNKDVVSLVNLLHGVIRWFNSETNLLYYQLNPFCSKNLIQFISQVPILYRVEFVSNLLANPSFHIIFTKNELFDPVPRKLEKQP